MSQIARLSNLAEPTLSHRLSYDLDLVIHPHPDIGAPQQFLPAVKAEAASAAAAIEPLCRPVPIDALRAWIRPIGAAVRNPPNQDDFAAWCAALVIACGDFAAGAFTASTQREALQTFQFFPSVADISGIVGPKSHSLRRKLAVLRQIANSRTEEQSRRRVPTEAERAAVSAVLATLPVSDDAAECEKPYVRPHAPVRSVEEQLAILRGEAA